MGQQVLTALRTTTSLAKRRRWQGSTHCPSPYPSVFSWWLGARGAPSPVIPCSAGLTGLCWTNEDMNFVGDPETPLRGQLRGL